MSVGKRIIAARKAQGLNQRMLAAKIGISPAVLCNWELGKRSPNVDSLLRVAAALGVEPAALLK